MKKPQQKTDSNKKPATTFLTGRKKIWLLCLLSFICFYGCRKESIFLKGRPVLTVSGAQKRFSSARIELSSDTVYRFVSDLVIKNGQTLSIEAGTLLRVNELVGIIIQPGGVINAKGTPELPIIFTVAAPKGAGGGLPSNTATNWKGIEIEGEQNKSSGILQYVRLEFAGIAPSGAALTVTNTDSLTVINHVQAAYSVSSSFIFSGGNCNTSYLVSLGANQSDIVFTNSHKGRLQHFLAYRIPLFPNRPLPNLGGVLIQGLHTKPIISNATVAGPDLRAGTSTTYLDTVNGRKAGIVVMDGAAFHIRNSIVFGFPAGGFYLDSRESAQSLAGAQSEFSYSSIHSNDSSRIFYLPDNLFPGIGSADLKLLLLQPQFNNSVLPSSEAFRLTDPFNWNAPNLFPAAASPLLNGAGFNGPVFDNPFFKKVNYRGAFGTEEWMKGWTNFTPLQTDYEEY